MLRSLHWPVILKTIARRRWTTVLCCAVCWGNAAAWAMAPPSPPMFTKRADSTAKFKTTAAPKTMRVVVIDAEKKPLKDVRIKAAASRLYTGATERRTYTTDARGQAVVELPKSVQCIKLEVYKNAYVPQVGFWGPGALASSYPIPARSIFQLQKGTTIGGFIKDEAGQPIAGVKVGVLCPRPGATLPDHISIEQIVAGEDDGCVTDAQGFWSINTVSADFRGTPLLSVTHPDYISDTTWGGVQKPQNITLAALRKQEAILTMRRGILLSGKVTDPAGNPVANAVVVWGDEPDYVHYRPHHREVLSDAQGVYHLPPLPPGNVKVAVIAAGWAPQLQEVALAPKNPPLNFVLEPGKTLRLRFVDPQHNPVPRVKVGVLDWRKCRMLYNLETPYRLETHIPNHADQHGRFVWTWAPDDIVRYGFSKYGFKSCHVDAGPTEDEEATVTLEPNP